jgi:hypothetical protein
MPALSKDKGYREAEMPVMAWPRPRPTPAETPYGPDHDGQGLGSSFWNWLGIGLGAVAILTGIGALVVAGLRRNVQTRRCVPRVISPRCRRRALSPEAATGPYLRPCRSETTVRAHSRDAARQIAFVCRCLRRCESRRHQHARPATRQRHDASLDAGAASPITGDPPPIAACTTD